MSAQFRTVRPEDHRDWYHGDSQAAEKCASPLHSKVLEHLGWEQREASCNCRTEHDVGCYRRSRSISNAISSSCACNDGKKTELWLNLQWQKSINQIVETRQKDTENTKPNEDSSSDWRYPMYSVCEACPCEPISDVTTCRVSCVDELTKTIRSETRMHLV